MATIMRGGIVRYNSVARALHWTMAALVIFNLAAGLFHDALRDTVSVMPVHKATGVLILALAIVRIGWRLTHRPPPLSGHLPPLERMAAGAVHSAFYALLVLMPLSGWIMSSAGPNPIRFYGLFDVPKFGVTREDAIAGIAGNGHGVMGWLLLGLIVLHVAAALRHHFVLKDAVLRRMI